MANTVEGASHAATAAPTITAAVLAHDEADLLDDCLASLGWADELLVVVDEAMSDALSEIARRRTKRVVVRPWPGFAAQRNRALDLAHGDWVLFVDADERVSAALAAEVRATLGGQGTGSVTVGGLATDSGAGGSQVAGAWVPRRNMIAGQWVRWAGWWPDRQLRLLRRGHARYDESALVHEVATLDGPAIILREPLLHLNYRSLADFRAKQPRYASLEARALLESDTLIRARSLVGQPLREFGRRYVELGGYRQGWLGLRLSLEMARSKYLTYREALRLARANLDRERHAGESVGPSLRSG